ncbi:hypothetical protein [Microbacterium paludicola]|uniref:hypothetical protein n=1 Tax=Microbacterium paludicola TaxID=300019 RepID=UPI000904597E|nr:hypothetical protein [Microbacterium paludicola]APF32859.1 hypothetical protein BO218_00480 [Microbacterium paludicola]
MAHYDLFDLDPHYRAQLDPAQIFFQWLRAREGGPADCFGATRLGFQIFRKEAKAECLLDYLFAWMAEADGTLVCGSYESYLLCVLTVSDVARRRKGFTRYDKGEYFIDDEMVGAESDATLRLPLTSREGDMRHPALDRAVFERCRSQREERRMTDLHFTIVHAQIRSGTASA